MSANPPTPPVGTVGWFDLTVPDATLVRDFYQAVVGWSATEVDMGGYADFMMNVPSTGTGVAGVCWKRGGNAALPSQWLIYISVADLAGSLAACEAGGGSVVLPPREMGSYGRYAVIRDPAGAVCALIQPPG
jgi:predicted enzyme related to lactoylglutathione lyase